MTDSLRKDILDGLKARLEAITAANGYRRTITTVAYEAKDWGEVPASARDWIGIVPQSEAFEDFPGHVKSTWDIDLVCHLTPSAATALAIMTANVDMMTDIRRKLMVAPPNLDVDGVHLCRVASRQGTEGDPAAVHDGVASTVVRIQVVFEEGLDST